MLFIVRKYFFHIKVYIYQILFRRPMYVGSIVTNYEENTEKFFRYTAFFVVFSEITFFGKGSVSFFHKQPW